MNPRDRHTCLQAEVERGLGKREAWPADSMQTLYYCPQGQDMPSTPHLTVLTQQLGLLKATRATAAWKSDRAVRVSLCVRF